MTIDRATLLNLAPEYYMLAFFIHFEYPQSYYTEQGLLKQFTYTDEGGETHELLANEAFRQEALRLLIRHNAIEVIADPFGPVLWTRGPAFNEMEEIHKSSPISPFFKADKSGDRRSWLMAALLKINRLAEELGVTPADFEQPPLDEWAPIQIDQNDEVVKEAVEKLRAATEAVEQDNGYAVAHAQERDQVVQDLKGGLEKLQSEAVSAGWISRTVDALKKAGARFVNTTKAPVIDGALAAIKDVVKKYFSSALDYLFSLFT
jgi:hypothetical protein